VAAVALLAGAATVDGSLQAAPTALARGLEHAWGDYGADGRTATGERDPEAGGAWTPDLLAAITELSGEQAEDLVVLSSLYELATFAPYHGFQQMTAHYANPLADFDARREQVEDWARASDGADLVRRLDTSPFRAPDVFVLHRAGDRLEIGMTTDIFPAEPNVGWETVSFDRALFDEALFDLRDVGPFTVVARR
ncbi:arabinofuranosyltransferase, partial [Kineococcus glutinatus]|uniref:arabinofuranosyltransferase n=1 Tax=Kineococcus glutinatus TaxID=1070872 RepID=UPI0031EBE323